MSNLYDEVCEYSYCIPVTENFTTQEEKERCEYEGNKSHTLCWNKCMNDYNPILGLGDKTNYSISDSACSNKCRNNFDTAKTQCLHDSLNITKK